MILVSDGINNMAGTPSSNKGAHGKMQKIAEGGTQKILVCKQGTWGVFSYLDGGQGALGPFLVGAVPPPPAMENCYIFT